MFCTRASFVMILRNANLLYILVLLVLTVKNRGKNSREANKKPGFAGFVFADAGYLDYFLGLTVFLPKFFLVSSYHA